MARSATARRPRVTATIARSIAIALAVFAIGSVRASVDGYAEVNLSDSERTTRSSGGPEQVQTIELVRSRFDLNWTERLWPNLKLTIGGFFERSETMQEFATAPGLSTDSTLRRFRPYVDLQMRTPTLAISANASRLQDDNEFEGFPRTRLTRDTFSAAGIWRPQNVRTVQLRLLRAKSYDENRTGLDLIEDSIRLTARTTTDHGLQLSYAGILDEREDRVDRLETRSVTHSGRVAWAAQLWNDRITISTDYLLTLRDFKTVASGTGDVDVPLFPFRGISGIDDTPESDPLPDNPQLIDGNRVASAGINLGLPALGGDDRPRNLGVDFRDPTALNVLRVWVDRELDPVIADAFSWEIWISDDEDRWTRVTTLPSAPFGPFENRFELRFPSITTRYIKLVVSPLSPADPSATEWPTILITELEPLQRSAAADVESESDTRLQRANVTTRTRLLADHDFFHELTLFVREGKASASTWSLSNGLFWRRALAESWTLRARAQRIDGRESGESRLSHLYSAAVDARPVEALRHNLSVTVQDDTVASRTTDRASVLLNSIAALYRGVDLSVALGRSWIEEPGPRRTDSDLANVVATLMPHPWFSLSLAWRYRSSAFDDPGPIDRREDFTRAQEVTASFRPAATLYLGGSYLELERPEIPTRVSRRLTASWLPFSDGTLRLTLFYVVTDGSNPMTRTRTFTPSLRWDIGPRWYLDVAYEDRSRDLNGDRTDDRTLRGLTRFSF